jgi:HEAT repeat protein
MAVVGRRLNFVTDCPRHIKSAQSLSYQVLQLQVNPLQLYCPITHRAIEMAPSAIQELDSSDDPTVTSLRKTLVTENLPLALRFRALFSLKHLASLDLPNAQSVPAIEAIAAAFNSSSALLKHELAYCLGQSKKLEAAPFLSKVLKDRQEDAMVRHESAEALGALGDVDSLELLKTFRDDTSDEEVVRETCEIAVARIEWEISEQRKQENVKTRLVWSKQ